MVTKDFLLATRLEKKSEMRLGPLDVLEFLFSSKTFCSFHGRCGGKRGKIVPHIVVHFSLLLRLRDTFVPLFLGVGSLFLAPLREREEGWICHLTSYPLPLFFFPQAEICGAIRSG